MWNTKIINFIEHELNNNVTLFKETPFYKGNPKIRKANLKFTLTTDEQVMMGRIENPQEFANFLSVGSRYHTDQTIECLNIFDYHLPIVEWANNIGQDQVNPTNVYIIAAARQMGTTTLGMIMAMHFTRINKGKTFLFVTSDTRSVSDYMNAIKTIYETMPFYMKLGVVSWNAKSIEFDNGSKIVASALETSIAKNNADFIFVDNAAFINKSVFKTIQDQIETLHANNEDSKYVIASYSEQEINQFTDLLYDVETSKKPHYKSIRLPWSVCHGNNETWKEHKLKSLSLEQFNKLYEVIMPGDLTKSQSKEITQQDVEMILGKHTHTHDTKITRQDTLEWALNEIKLLKALLNTRVVNSKDLPG